MKNELYSENLKKVAVALAEAMWRDREAAKFDVSRPLFSADPYAYALAAIHSMDMVNVRRDLYCEAEKIKNGVYARLTKEAKKKAKARLEKAGVTVIA